MEGRKGLGFVLRESTLGESARELVSFTAVSYQDNLEGSGLLKPD